MYKSNIHNINKTNNDQKKQNINFKKGQKHTSLDEQILHTRKKITNKEKI